MTRRSGKRRIRADALRSPAKPQRPVPSANPGYYEAAQRPLQCLAFLAPLIIIYELGLALLHNGQQTSQRPDLAAQLLLQWFFSLFGATGYYLPGFALVAVLLAWHVFARLPWKVEPVVLAGMLAESVLLSIPLLMMNRLLSTSALAGATMMKSSISADLLLSIGAGLYEELVFRLMLISMLMLLLKDIGGMRESVAVALAVVVSSLAFAAHHYQPIGNDPFSPRDFAFRATAGAYLAGVFVTRGFGIAVGSHAVYDIIVVALL